MLSSRIMDIPVWRLSLSPHAVEHREISAESLCMYFAWCASDNTRDVSRIQDLQG
jgi:hypothetical protein